MSDLLSTVHFPDGLKELTTEQLEILCGEIRSFLIDNVSKTGGHLASNLGVVELSVAIHKVFDTPYDKIIWDVGHQSYVHKILTGRLDEFRTLRSYGGISGFPKRSESEHDCFDTGHSSTSVSAALGMARARDLNGDKYSVVAVLGDGALTGGMIYEAMNDAGRCHTPLILILNDNAMSISKNVGAVSRHLSSLRLNPTYFKSKKAVWNFLNRVPGGKSVAYFLRAFKRALRSVAIPDPLFSNFGFRYIGPADGHDIESLTEILNYAKQLSEPVLIHVCTKKGKGYTPAEKNPEIYHGVGPFDPEKGVLCGQCKCYSSVFGNKLLELAENDRRICAITCAMPDSTGLMPFAKKFPKRFFDVGIAEPHGVTMAAGLAAGGMIPVIPVYSTFLQRAYDQILHDVCLQNLHVVFPVDRAGIVGADGETHQGVFDISYLSQMPGITLLSPVNFGQLEKMLEYAVNECDGPIAIRYPRGGEEFKDAGPEFSPLMKISDGGNIVIIAAGRMINTAGSVVRKLKSVGYDASLYLLAVLSPLDTQALEKTLHDACYTAVMEDNVKNGGIGEAIAALAGENSYNTRVRIFAFPDEPIPHGSISDLDKRYGLDDESVYHTIMQDIEKENKQNAEKKA